MLSSKFVVPFILGVFLSSSASAGPPVKAATIKADLRRELKSESPDPSTGTLRGGLTVTDVKPEGQGSLSNVVSDGVPIPHFSQEVWVFYTDKFAAKFKQFVTVEYEKVGGTWSLQNIDRHIATELSPPKKLPPKPPLPAKDALIKMTTALYGTSSAAVIDEMEVGSGEPKFEWVLSNDDRIPTYSVPLARIVFKGVDGAGSPTGAAWKCEDIVVQLDLVNKEWERRTLSPKLIGKGEHRFDYKECTMVGEAPSGPRKK